MHSTPTHEDLRQQILSLSPFEFLNLGAGHVAYIARDEENPGVYGIFAGNGLRIGSSPSMELAEAMVKQHDFKLADVH